jgi:uncharacterized surface protein with fasciclin (FAS1) repeats
MIMRTAGAWLFVLLLALALPAQGAPHKPAKISDLDDMLNKTVILSKFATLVRTANLGTFLSSRGPFTLFAPTNSAFTKLPPGTFEDLLRPENKVQLQRVVLFQLVSGRAWDLKDMGTTKLLLSCEGSPLSLRLNRSGAQRIDKARIIRADIHCANGLLHQVDTLLMPPHLLLVAAVENADAVATTNAAPANPADGTNAPPTTNTVPLDPATVINPTNATPVPAPAQGPSMR